MSRIRLSLLLALSLTACVKASNSPQSTQRDLITEAEIASSNAMNAYDAIRRPRGSTPPSKRRPRNWSYPSGSGG